MIAPLIFTALACLPSAVGGHVSAPIAHVPTVIAPTVVSASLARSASSFQVQIPSPDPGHADWGPQPPVAPETDSPLPETDEVCPIVFPLIGKSAYDHSFNKDYGGYRHTGIDIRAPKFTPIVAPFDGVIGLKEDSFWIYGDNGWITLGTHLNDDSMQAHDHAGGRDLMFAPYLRPYQHVSAGQFLGYVGMSGNATGPHLHFELYRPGKGRTMSRIVDPFRSLKKAEVLSEPKPIFAKRDSSDPSATLLYGCIRGFDKKSKSLALLLVQRQNPDGRVYVSIFPHWVSIHVTSTDIADLGGSIGIGETPKWKVICLAVGPGPSRDKWESKGVVFAHPAISLEPIQ